MDSIRANRLGIRQVYLTADAFLCPTYDNHAYVDFNKNVKVRDASGKFMWKSHFKSLPASLSSTSRIDKKTSARLRRPYSSLV